MKDAAIKAASTWAGWSQLNPMAQAEFAAAVTNVKVEEQVFVRARWRGTARRIAVRQVTTKNRARKLADPISASDFDPWRENSKELAERTKQLTVCGSCNGEKKIECEACGGVLKVTCEFCDGSGSAISEKTGRIINCRRCKGTGQRKCKCRKGLIKCPTCSGKGKVDRWLEVEEEHFSRERYIQEPSPVKGIPSGVALMDFSQQPDLQKVDTVAAWTGATEDEAPPNVAHWLHRHECLGVTTDGEDHVDGVDLQVFTWPVTTIDYSLAGVAGQIVTVGKNHEVLPQPSATAFDRRKKVLAITAGVGFLVGLFIWLRYTLTHDYLSDTGNSSVLGFLALVLPVVLVPVAAVACLPKPLSRTKILGPVVAPLAFVLLLQFLLSVTGYPSGSDAQEYLKEGEFAQARREAKASLDLEIDEVESKKVLDQLHLKEVISMKDGKTAMKAAEMPFYTQKVGDKAKSHAAERIIKDIQADQARGKFASTIPLIVMLPPGYGKQERVRKLQSAYHLDHAGRCLKGKNAGCAITQLKLAKVRGASGKGYDKLAIKALELDKQQKAEAARAAAKARAEAAKRKAEEERAAAKATAAAKREAKREARRRRRYRSCCKICTTGKACGNSCISRRKRCRRGRGCACNG